MIRRGLVLPAQLWMIGLLPLMAACADQPQTAQSRADAATAAACRQRADEVYSQRYRGQTYNVQQTQNTPFSGNYTQPPDRELSQLYTRNSMVRDCIRNTGTETDRTMPAPEVSPPSSSPSAR
jgi:hypothetical protein